MSKKQKILLWVFMGMFIIPEVLWSPAANYIYSLAKPTKEGSVQILRSNFLLESSFDNAFSTVLFIQLLGLLLSAIYLIVINKSIKNKWLLWPLVVLLLLASVIVFYLFGFSIKLRSFGF